MTIRVLHIFSPYYQYCFGGQTIFWKYAFNNWNEAQVVHYVLNSKQNELVKSKVAFDFEYPDIQYRFSRIERAIWIYPLFKSLLKYEGEYDILHVHVLWWGSLLIGPWSKVNHVPALYESILLDSDTPGQLSQGKLGKLKLRLLKKYKAILAISEYLAEEYRKFGFSREQVFNLMNSVDLDLFYPPDSCQEKMKLREANGLPLESKILVFVGSVKERKGVDLLIKAFIQAAIERKVLHLLVVGPKHKKASPSIDEEFVDDLHTQVKEHGLSARVTFTGMIQDRQHLADIYRASDMFVFPSRKEGLGNVVLEAMATGLPAIVSQLPVLKNVIQHGKNGLFVPIGDEKALKDAILTLCDNTELSQALGNNAKITVREAHSFEKWQSELVAFYERLLS